MRRDDASLLDIVIACRYIIRFAADVDTFTFFEDKKTQFAILQQLTVIGEAVKRISAEFRDQHPEIPWRNIAGLRDNLVHEYDHIDLDTIWDVATQRIPVLLSQIEPLIPPQP